MIAKGLAVLSAATTASAAITFSRTVEQIPSWASGTVSVEGSACKSTDKYGSNDCTLNWGSTYTIDADVTTTQALPTGTVALDLKIDGLIPFKASCKVCGENCTITVPVVKKTVSFYPGDCPIKAQTYKNNTPVTIPAAPSTLPKTSVKGTATLTDGSGATLAVLGVDASVDKSAAEAERLAMIDDINSKAETWTAGVNSRFAGAAVGVSKSLCGVKDGHADRLAEAVRAGRVVRVKASGRAIPSDFDSASNWPKCAKVINDIRDQSNCGCCWAFGSAEAASDRMCIATNASVEVPLSAEQLCFCSSYDGCGGGFPESAWDFIKSTGLVTGNQQKFTATGPNPDPFAGQGLCSAFSLPHCHHHGPQGSDPFPAEGASGCPSESSPSCPKKCDSDAKAPHNDFKSDKHSFSGSVATFDSADAIAESIMQSGPVTAAFTVYADFENYVSGVYKHTSGSQLGGHAVKIVGFGTTSAGVKYWKVANSWNPYWGEKGYFRIARGNNECGIEGQVVASAADAKWNVPTY
eukprot:TRINITY_DN794_c0_g1_i1.p1 TRINITY_DN794_c0_g1~~TRINITY_DN794_c0_g1_i1.p1  ORF type:complete len:523 (+),score=203.80 TRINITY_DN794_c0_g1_i1:64-1632(+)